MPALEARHHHHHRNLMESFYNFLGMTHPTWRFPEYKDSCTLPILGGWLRREKPPDADNDKLHARWLIEHDWETRIPTLPATTLMAENGGKERYAIQALRWMRTTWRINPEGSHISGSDKGIRLLRSRWIFGGSG